MGEIEKKIRRERKNAKRKGFVRRPPYERFSKISHYGMLFRSLREYMFITRQELAWMMGVDTMTVANFEDNLHDVGFETVRKMAECMGLKISITFAGLGDSELGLFPHLLHRGHMLAENFAAFSRYRRKEGHDYPSYQELYKKFEESWQANPGPPKYEAPVEIQRSGYADDLENDGIDGSDFMDENDNEELWDMSKW